VFRKFFKNPHFESASRAAAPIALGGSANYFLICAYTLCVAIESWTSNSIPVVLIDMAGSLGVSNDEASWIITIYSAAAAISIVTSHNICKITGERLYILLAALLFGGASAGCALSTNLETLLTFRFLQGLAGGAFMSRTLVLLVTHFDPAVRSRALRYYLLILFILGRFAAPLLGGLLSDWMSWRFMFWLNCFLSLVAVWFFCISPNQEKLVPPLSRRRLHFDFLGAALLVTGVAGVQIVLSRGEVDNWMSSPLIRTALCVGVAAHIGFVLWQLSPYNHDPLVHLRHALRRGLFSVVLLGVFLGTLFSAIVYVFPYYLRQSEVHSAAQCGLMMSVVGLPMIALGLVAPHFTAMVTRLGGRVVLWIGLSMLLADCGLMVLVMTKDTPDLYLLPSLMLTGAFIYFTAVGLALAGFAGVPVRRISNARTIYFGARQLGNSLGISVGIILLDRRQEMHSERLLESYFLRDHAAQPANFTWSVSAITEKFGHNVLGQAVLLSYQDMFVAVAAVALLTMLCVFLLPASKGQASTAAQTTSTAMAVEDAL
jgi:DHA2 family multidrug resistance protein